MAVAEEKISVDHIIIDGFITTLGQSEAALNKQSTKEGGQGCDLTQLLFKP